MKQYDFSDIERRAQELWRKEGIYEPDIAKAKKPFYNLMMFPYPSAEGLHVGNMYAFTGTDIYGRFKRMQGNDVFEPIGLDGFGIHSENYALKVGTHPKAQAATSEERFYKQLESVGNGFAWKEHLETYDPEYYKWTQWIFIQLFKAGLAYRKKQAVNWCPSCKTVLADEQVITGKCERCSSVVEKRELEQWFFKITNYAEQLLQNLEQLDWSEKVRIAQRNWIGKSEGAELDFPISHKFNYVILHGFTADPEEDFHPWLKKSLEKIGAKVYVPALPNTDAPTEEEQVAFVLKNAQFDEHTILLGHSLGSVVALKVLEKLEKPIAGLVTAGGFIDTEFKDHDRSFDKTFNWKFDFKKIKENVGWIKILQDANDSAVSEAQGRRLADALGVDLEIVVAEESHFCGKEEPVILEHVHPQIKVFTTRPDTLFGATYMVVAPENVVITGLKSLVENWSEVEAYITAAKSKSEEERVEEGKEKTGVELKGIRAINPATGEEIPIWVADYVLGGYGTGAIMAVPAHDARDFAFAKKYNLPVKTVVSGGKDGELYEGEGLLTNSGKFDGMDSEKAKWAIADAVGGKKKIQYRLRDWLISRQRYWGPPIPMIFCEKDEWQPVPEKDLPVLLPDVKDFRPTGTGKSPLASEESFYKTTCPKCGGEARRETDVSDTFLDSAWYYLRYPTVGTLHENEVPWDKEITKKWFPVNMYIGGAEHSVLHLLYVRFVSLALHDLGLLAFGPSSAPKGEPFPIFRAHGLVIKDGAKMSKSKGNVVNPDEYVKKFGADALRMYLMFLAPFEQGGDFRDKGILGVTRFLERTWKYAGNIEEKGSETTLRAAHRAIKKVTEDIESIHYNTAVSALMICLNSFEEAGKAGKEEFSIFLRLLAPFAPHLTDMLWREVLGEKQSIHSAEWPRYNSALTEEARATLVIQVNGKVRDTVDVEKGLSEAQATEIAQAREKIKPLINGQTIKKTIYVEAKIINFIV